VVGKGDIFSERLRGRGWGRRPAVQCIHASGRLPLALPDVIGTSRSATVKANATDEQIASKFFYPVLAMA
jgi:hypothetical protein